MRFRRCSQSCSYEDGSLLDWPPTFTNEGPDGAYHIMSGRHYQATYADSLGHKAHYHRSAIPQLEVSVFSCTLWLAVLHAAYLPARIQLFFLPCSAKTAQGS